MPFSWIDIISTNRTNLFIVDEASDLHFHIIIILLKILLTTPDKVIRSGIGGGNDREKNPNERIIVVLLQYNKL